MLSLILKYASTFPTKESEYAWLSRSPFITIDTVLANMDKPWHWPSLTVNSSISWDDKCITYKNLPWDSFRLIKLTNGDYDKPPVRIPSIQDVFNSPDAPWNWSFLMKNLPVTLQDIRNHPDIIWDWPILLSNKHITLDAIHEISEGTYIQDLDWTQISFNPNITLDFIFKHSDKTWIWHIISEYADITTFDVIRSSPPHTAPPHTAPPHTAPPHTAPPHTAPLWHYSCLARNPMSRAIRNMHTVRIWLRTCIARFRARRVITQMVALMCEPGGFLMRQSERHFNTTCVQTNLRKPQASGMAESNIPAQAWV